MKKGYTIVELLFIIYILAVVSVAVSIGYVAIHYISKFW